MLNILDCTNIQPELKSIQNLFNVDGVKGSKKSYNLIGTFQVFDLSIWESFNIFADIYTRSDIYNVILVSNLFFR